MDSQILKYEQLVEDKDTHTAYLLKMQDQLKSDLHELQ